MIGQMGKVKDSVLSLPEGTKVPNHIAMILDGNRRWARSRGLKPWEGHRAGYLALKKVARASRILGVHTFTVWGFSTENWERPEVEIQEIVKLLSLALDEMEQELHEEKVRLVHLGRKDRFPKEVVDKIVRLEKATAKYGNNTFNIALDYGGHDEIVRAIKKMMADGVAADAVDAKLIEKYLDTGDQPYPYVDLFIRTSGEQRTSGLLPWQMDYAEYYFELDHLPDFTIEKLKEAILDFSRRRRRFGGNDAMEHMQFDPGLVAKLEMDWQQALQAGHKDRLRDKVVAYVKEHYGFSGEAAKKAGGQMMKALISGKEADWEQAGKALEEWYGAVKAKLGLAFEPDVVAKIELELWKGEASEDKFRQLLAEKFRFSNFQAAKSAHLAYLANVEMARNNWEKARGYMEKFYQALKERVA
jgi:undecaprenyl diphosphate synthase